MNYYEKNGTITYRVARWQMLAVKRIALNHGINVYCMNIFITTFGEERVWCTEFAAITCAEICMTHDHKSIFSHRILLP